MRLFQVEGECLDLLVISVPSPLGHYLVRKHNGGSEDGQKTTTEQERRAMVAAVRQGQQAVARRFGVNSTPYNIGSNALWANALTALIGATALASPTSQSHRPTNGRPPYRNTPPTPSAGGSGPHPVRHKRCLIAEPTRTSRNFWDQLAFFSEPGYAVATLVLSSATALQCTAGGKPA